MPFWKHVVPKKQKPASSGTGKPGPGIIGDVVTESAQEPEILASASTAHIPPYGIRVWDDCPDAKLDICFVHGLTGNRDTTWTAHGRVVPWPKTLLSPKLPKARLFTYGYDAYVVRGSVAGQNRVSDHAVNLLADITNDRESIGASHRPIIFVVHSLGGLITKQAILLSRSGFEEHLTYLFRSLRGVIFMGTPHSGSWMAKWAKIPASTLGFLKSTNVSLLRILTKNDELLESIQRDFFTMVRSERDKGRGLEIACFFEEKPLSAIGTTVVSRESATFPGYTSQSIPANHSDMVKFDSPEDPGFKRLFHVLERWANQASETHDDSLSGTMPTRTADTHIPAHQSTTPYSYLPLKRSRGFKFIGRTRDLNLLHGRLFDQQDSESFALVGLGGIGKTQMAMQLVLWLQENKPQYSVFWIPALSVATYEKACTEIIEELGLQTIKSEEKANETLRKYLSSESSGQWLLIIDNADDTDIMFGSGSAPGIHSLLPRSNLGMTLFTTRFHDIAARLTTDPRDIFMLDRMPDGDANTYLRQLLNDDLVVDETEAKRLLDKLACLPLAIKQAAFFMNRNHTTITRYLEMLGGTKQDTIDLMNEEFHDETRYVESINAVAATWVISFTQLRELDPIAADFLSFLSCVEPQGIPRSLLPSVESKVQLERAVGTLCGYAFLTQRENTEWFDMHSLVHLAATSWLDKCDQVEETNAKAIEHIWTIFPQDIYNDREIWRRYLPHALKALRGSNELFPKSIQQSYDGWRGYLSHTFKFWQSPDSVENNKALKLASIVGRCLLEDGRPKEAIEILEHVIARGKALSEDHPDQLASQYGLSGAYLYEGRVSEAITILEHIMSRGQATLSEQLPRLLISEHELAKVYLRDGRPEDAIKTLESVVSRRQETLTTDDPDLVASQLDLAGAYVDNGRAKKGIAIVRHVISRERKYSDNLPRRFTVQHETSSVCLKTGQVKGAIAILKFLVSRKMPAHSEGYSERVASQYKLARKYLDNNRVKEGITILEHVIPREQVLSEDHLNHLRFQYEVAETYLSNGQAEDATIILEYILSRERNLSEEHADRLAAQNRLAAAYLDTGRAEEAAVILNFVVLKRQDLLPRNDPDLLASQELQSRAGRMQQSQKDDSGL